MSFVVKIFIGCDPRPRWVNPWLKFFGFGARESWCEVSVAQVHECLALILFP